MTNLTQKLAVGVVALLAGLVVGWAVRGVLGYNTATQFLTVYDSWRVGCPAADLKGASCQMVQDILDGQSHAEIARIAIGRQSPTAKQLTLDVVMPLGVALEPGIGLVMGSDPIRTAKYRTCTQQGCAVDMLIDDKLQASFDAGKDGKLLFAGVSDNKPIAIPVSLKGYAAAKRAYERNEAKRGSWFWRMWS